MMITLRWLAVWTGSLGLAGCGAYAYRSTPSHVVAAKPSILKAEAAPIAMADTAPPADMEGVGESAPPPPPPAPAQLGTPAADEKLVVEAWIELRAANVTEAAAAIRAQVRAAGGRVVEEQLSGNALDASEGLLRLRLPPAEAGKFLDGLGSLGEVTARRVQATDVGKKLVDLDLALKNHRTAMARLEELLKKPSLATADVLAIEKEMTRLRGEIERIEGEQRWLTDHVDYATIEITLRRQGGAAVFAPEAKLHPGAHASMLTLWDPAGREGTRFGGGVTLHVDRTFTADLSLYPSVNGEGQVVIATFGGGVYSQFLGDGKRRFLNPYVGTRLGYGFLGTSRFVVAGEVGLEIFKSKYALVDLSFRGLGLFGEDQDGAVQGVAGVMFAF